ncbi:MAG TPA: GyrI-like domain-containing protein [Planctomycetota bacterium]|nr:GyrI-like domain-containing protein [Planctomycetota bacterium]
MEYQVELKEVRAGILAAVRARTSPDTISKDIPALLGEVWGFLKGTDLRKDGHNVVLYHGGLADLEAGVQVSRSFEGTGRVHCSSTPAGLAAAALHRGPYHLLPRAHEAIGKWCVGKDYEATGLTWEVYGDWCEAPEKLETEVFHQLRRR